MHTWSKRGLQTAFITGGLLMLGTGIASATENHSPEAQPVGIDRLANPAPQDTAATAPLLDVPLQIANNSVNTPIGPIAAGTTSSDMPVGSSAPAVVNGITRSVAGTDVAATVCAPIQVVNNQAGVLAPASNGGASYSQNCAAPTPVTSPGTAGGTDPTLRGNVVRVSDLVPVQAANNAAAVGSDAVANGSACQAATGGGDITTDGSNGTISGTIADQRGALPIGAGGNAVGVVGSSGAGSTTSQSAVNNALDTTHGDHGILAGTAAIVPVATSVVGNTNAVSAVGHTVAGTPATLPVSAGGQNPNTSTTVASATGDTFAKAPDSVASGTIAETPVAVATGLYGQAVGADGSAVAQHTGSSIAQAGGSTYGNADNGVASGTTAATPTAVVPEVSCLVAGAVGTGSGTCAAETRNAQAGFYNGSTGNNAVASGTIAQVPTALPLEVLSNAASAAGTGGSAFTGTKTVAAGWTPNSHDDNGTVSSNVAQAANSVPVLVSGLAVPAVGKAAAASQVNENSTAGLPPEATGKHSILSGNVVPESAAPDVMVEQVVASAAGDGVSAVDSTVASKAGGPADTTGEGGTGSGNIVPVPVSGVESVSGLNAAAVGTATGLLRQTDTSVAGGDNTTSGANGTVSGIIADVPANVAAAVPGNAVTAVGRATGDSATFHGMSAGGNDTTDGTNGTVSGIIGQVSAAPVARVVAVAANAAGRGANATSTDVAPDRVAGNRTTNGTGGTLSGDIVNPEAKAFTGLESAAVNVLGQDTIGTGTNGFNGAPNGTSTTAGSGPLNGMTLPVPVVLNAPVRQLTVPLGSGVTKATTTDQPGRWLDGTDVPLSLGGANGLL